MSREHTNAYRRTRYAENPKVREYQLKYQAEKRQRDPAGMLLKQCRSNAKRQDKPFELTKMDIAKMLEPMQCKVTGVKLRWDRSIPHDPIAPSIDKIDPEKGYVKGNVRIVSWIYNLAKSTFTDEEVLQYLIRPMEGRNKCH